MPNTVILSAVRTPIGSFMGTLSSVPAPRLGAVAIKGAMAAIQWKNDEQVLPEQVIMGQVLQAGVGQAPARQAAIYSGLPTHVGAITLHKVCGSGMRSIMDGRNGIEAGEWDCVIAGGMESMSNAPHLLANHRKGEKMGHLKTLDSMLHDGLWDPYGDKHMGHCAELCAQKYAFTREKQDAFALESYLRAQKAMKSGLFRDEMVPVFVTQRRGEPLEVNCDEEPTKAPLEKMGSLRPAFDKNGTVTAANSSKLNDGAAALVLCSEHVANQATQAPLAKILSQASFGQAPEWFTTSPAGAVRKALDKANLKVDDIGAWEINEAFSVVAMAAIQDLQLDPTLVNMRGGAVALGHPIGCSGARIVTTLLHTLRAHKIRYGCAGICIGGGEATALVVENLAC
jgi:acetyl-CoA C-acetyltransferase